ncbi:ArsR family transcriptional regulator [Ochrobactrum sp. MYb15]|uniref:ArsR/SmtB family transcription factor n=1 Tax=Brucella TaxID=234 RepID=UPI00046785AB|nr:metalloregulator ArsR/SmtB family transcription factor [Brucella rhizosphaerae]PQZ49443.1 ArsR family transcriptional regulator [Ochrobactrum sp. MYb19]PRA66739.1 ArsR family transcriptional regulator [Ochrobactrum sp. MYb18]PRA76231.1 ArsR family transcriptional regulator [Brucella thiophenivorans]PRA91749.1 ArsR family transcriptional regulator [Ochrobactrum sp. MYb14]PRA98238.1 ArsR family transcriptional regulator [Ochrobactrum sp. MYb15]
MKISPEAMSDVFPGVDDDLAARIYAALGHPVRIHILRQLIFEDACCCKDIVGRLDLAQSTVSQHLKVLVQAGLIDYRPDRQTSRYSVNWQQLTIIRSHLAAFRNGCCETTV